MVMPKLLVIDNDPAVFHAFRRFFREGEVELRSAATATQGMELVSRSRPDAIVLDLNLPDLPGLETFRRIREVDARIPVVFIASDGSAQTAIEAMKQGAHDYLLKPLASAQVREVIESAFRLSHLMRVPALLEHEPAPERGDIIIGRCPAMQEVYKAIGRVAPQDLNVLITGESGTGKELVARAIYQHSRRAAGPFLAINCAAIPETLLESELFGHEKGAFTGADRQRVGKFEQCNGGTLFLDEIGDMSPLTQAKVLRLLQEQTFERVGGNETIRANVRVLAATNRDLEKTVGEGNFRVDLFYRLSVFAIALPPLRERGEDLPLLVEYFLKRFSRELDRRVSQAAPEALEVLAGHSWPGNLRELQSVLKQALLRSRGPVLLPEFLPTSLVANGKAEENGAFFPGLDGFIRQRLQDSPGRLYAEYQAETERYLFTRVMRHTRGNQVRAARLLGIPRGKLRTKLRALGLPTRRANWTEIDQPNAATDSK
jgi:two-component system nitrogen regulation response regulator GlnG